MERGDGEVGDGVGRGGSGDEGRLQMVPEDRKGLILSDSQAAIAAVRKAGRTGRSRAGELKEVVEEVRKRSSDLRG